MEFIGESHQFIPTFEPGLFPYLNQVVRRTQNLNFVLYEQNIYFFNLRAKYAINFKLGVANF